MTTMYAAIKWPVDATPDEIDRAIQTDLPILALTLVEEHGFTFARIEELFNEAVDTVEWHL